MCKYFHVQVLLGCPTITMCTKKYLFRFLLLYFVFVFRFLVVGGCGGVVVVWGVFGGWEVEGWGCSSLGDSHVDNWRSEERWARDVTDTFCHTCRPWF